MYQRERPPAEQARCHSSQLDHSVTFRRLRGTKVHRTWSSWEDGSFHSSCKDSSRRSSPNTNRLLQFTAGSFISVTIWEYEKIRSRALNAINNANPLTWMRRKAQEKPLSDADAEVRRLKKEISVLWNKLTPGEQVFAPILAINVLVYSMWRVPRLKAVMLHYFCSNPAAKAVCWPMVLSTFSHYSLFHLFANMFVLHSFSAATNSLGREQFLGLYLSAGVISSFASYALKIVSANPGYSLGAVSLKNFFCVYLWIKFKSFPVWSHHGHPGLHMLTVPRYKVVNPLRSPTSILRWISNSSNHGFRCRWIDLQMEAVRPRGASWRSLRRPFLELLRAAASLAASRTFRGLLARTSRENTEMNFRNTSRLCCNLFSWTKRREI